MSETVLAIIGTLASSAVAAWFVWAKILKVRTEKKTEDKKASTSANASTRDFLDSQIEKLIARLHKTEENNDNNRREIEDLKREVNYLAPYVAYANAQTEYMKSKGIEPLPPPVDYWGGNKYDLTK